jgi:hypothetical protein
MLILPMSPLAPAGRSAVTRNWWLWRSTIVATSLPHSDSSDWMRWALLMFSNLPPVNWVTLRPICVWLPPPLAVVAPAL